MNKFSSLALASSVFFLIGCEPTEQPAPETSPQDAFFERLTLLCDKAYEGRLVSDEQIDADFSGKPMVMHVAKCDLSQIQIPFHIGQENGEWDRSRTWFISRTDNGLRLKHRHRHEDGSLDTVTNYGGDTADEGTEDRQDFPIDEETKTLFKANDLAQSIINTWAVEISPPGKKDARFAYELRRPEGPAKRFFRVEFDLSKPVETPPPAWGD